MKKITLLVVFLLFAMLGGYAQSSQYGFAQSAGTYVPITGGTVITSANNYSPTLDSYASAELTLPAQFEFAGVTYTKYYVTSNGQLSLGTTAPSSTNYTVLSSNTGNNVFLSPFSADLSAAAAGVSEIRVQQVGDEIVVQWSNFRRYLKLEAFSFQVRLNTLDKSVKFVYDGTPPFAVSTDYQPQVGIKNATTDYKALTVAAAGSWNTPTVVTSGITSTSIATFNGPVGFTSGLTYTFTLPPACTGTPVAGTVGGDAVRNVCTSVVPGAITVTGASILIPGISYQWEQSTDAGNTWVNAVGGSGAATLSYTPPAFSGAAIQYRLKVSCATGAASATTSTVTITQPVAPSTQVTAFTSNTVAANTFSLGWTNGNGTRRYVVLSTTPIVDPANGSYPAFTTNAVYTGPGQQIVYDGTGSSVTVTGLACNTTYYAKVYEYNRCGSGPYDIYFNLTTGTNGTTVTTGPVTAAGLPLTNNFTGFTGTNLPASVQGWYEAAIVTVANATPTNANPVGNTSAWGNSTVFGTTTARINLYTNTRNEWIISPKMTITANSRLKFKAAITDYLSGSADSGRMQGTDDKVVVLVSTDGCGAVWTPVYTFQASNTTALTNVLTDYTVLLNAYVGQTIQIAFQAIDGPVNDDPDYDFHIGNILIEEIPACDVPVLAATTNLTKNSATIGWQVPATGVPSGYQYVVSTTATAPAGAGTGVAATQTSVNVSSLLPSTTYYIYVRTVCGSDFSDWSVAGTFTTMCDYPEITATAPGTVCGQGTATLGATSVGTVRWFTAQTGGSPVATGATYTTPQITATTTYYVESASEGVQMSGGKNAPATDATSSTSTNYGIVFNLATATKLERVSVYASAAGTLNVKIVNAAGTEVYATGNVNVTAGGTTTPNFIPLDIELPAGNGYKMLIKSYTASIIRDSAGFTFPYVSADGNLTVTSSEWGGTTTSYYYYFYDIKYKSVCASPRQAVVATVTPAPAITATTTDATICNGESTGLSVTSANASYSYVWMPGNLTGASQTVSPTSTTTYTVTATDTTSGCVTVGAVTVTVNPLPTAIVVSPAIAVCEGGVGQITATGGVVPTQVFAENFNTASTQFTAGANATVTANATYYAEGTGSALFTTSSTSSDVNYAQNSNINLTGYSSAQVTFSHIVGMEGTAYSYDLGYVQYSADGGTTWTTFPTSSYAGNGTLITNQGSGTNPVSGVVFSNRSYADWNAQFVDGTSTPGAGPATALWKNETINVPAAALTSQFRIRFRYTTDISVFYYGWLIDNVKVTGYSSQIAWAPATNLYTDAAATQAYQAGTFAPTVYVAPTAPATYTATATNPVTGCNVTANVNITITTTPAPTVANATQTFCAGATVASLEATGTTLQWYAAATGGTALPATTALVNNTTYYASQTVNGCQSIGRTPVVAVVNTTAAPTAAAQAFCDAATVADLEATGTAIQWYAAATGGTALAADAALATGSYYASQTLNGCESTRVEVAVTINVTPAPTAAAQAFCDAATVADLDATGTAIQWYAAATGGTALAADAALATGSYYASQTLNDCESARVEVAVTINVTPAPAAAAQAFCDAATVADLDATGTAVQWYAAATGGTALAADAALATGSYYASQTLNGCESTRVEVAVTINVTPAPAATAQAFCDAATVADLDATGTAVQWYAAATGGTALTADAALATGTYYVSQTLNGCESATRTEVAVTVNVTPAVQGATTQQIAVAEGENATIEDITVTAEGTVTWYATLADAQAGTGALTAGTVLVTNSTYYAVQTLNGCTSADVLAVTVTLTLGRDDFDMSAFAYYPNPVKDVITITYNKEITSVSVISLLGQEVIKVTPNVTEARIDMSGLAEGSYLLTVQSGNAVKTVKVLKGNR